MKGLTYCTVLVLLTLLSLPVTADAFSRRPSRSEVQSQPQSVPLENRTQTIEGLDQRTPQSVPEPSSLLMLGMGVGLLVLFSVRKRLSREDA